MNDLKQFKHGEEGTHCVCNKQLKEEGGEAKCCYCFSHKGCDFNDKKYMTRGYKRNY